MGRKVIQITALLYSIFCMDNHYPAAALTTMAYEFQTAFSHGYPTETVGDPAVVSAALMSKWGRFFTACAPGCQPAGHT